MKPTLTTGQIWRTGLLAMLLAAALNTLIRLASLALFAIPADFFALTTAAPVLILTVLGTLGATFVFARLSRRGANPIKTFQIVALVVLLLSFIPNVFQLLDPNAGAAAALTLMSMHVVTVGIVVGLFSRLGTSARPLQEAVGA
jgi:hypothetical protein